MDSNTKAPTHFSVYIAISADGFIARADGALDWLASVEAEGEDYGYQAFADTVDTLVIGRGTYDVARGFSSWPYQGKRCIVLTHRSVMPLHGEEFFAGEASELATRLSAEGARRVYVDGGQVIGQFLAANLVTDLTLSIIPVLLGDGIPLFRGGRPEHRLRLEHSQAYASGLVQVRYRLD